MFNHPKGLYVLFFTEMWERFSFYGMKALLIFFLTKHHFFTDGEANHIIGNYAALVYALPVIGGFLADRYLGYRKAVTFGAILILAGQFSMAYKGHQAITNGTELLQDNIAIQAMFFSLALIIAGVGFLKANISSIVGCLYKKDDPKKDSGFTIFYMGINLGSALATALCGYVGETYGWEYGFGLAGIGMLLGLSTFLIFKKHLMGYAEPPDQQKLNEKTILLLPREWAIYAGGAASVFIIWQLVQYHAVVGALLVITSLTLIGLLGYFILSQCTKDERGRMLVLLILTFSSIVFWSLFEQEFTSLNLFADRVVNRSIGGQEIKASTLLSLNPVFIILLAPVFAWLWIRLNRIGLEPNTPVKFSLGIIFAGLSFGAIVAGCMAAQYSSKVSLGWLVLSYLLLTTGEICLSPVGLSAVTKLSADKIVGVMMGTWFLATAASEYIAALLANLADLGSVSSSFVLSDAIRQYSDLYLKLMIIGLIAGILLLILSPFLKKHMHGIH